MKIGCVGCSIGWLICVGWLYFCVGLNVCCENVFG